MMNDTIVSLTLSQKDERKSLIKHLLDLKNPSSVNGEIVFDINKIGSTLKVFCPMNPSLDEGTLLYDVTAITTSTSQWDFWWRPITKAWLIPFFLMLCDKPSSKIPGLKREMLQDEHHRGKSQC